MTSLSKAIKRQYESILSVSHHPPPFPAALLSAIRRQDGSVLILSLLIIILLVLVGVFASNRSAIESRIAANNKLSTQVFYATQAGIEEARMRLAEIGQVEAPTAQWRTFIGGASPATALFGYNPTDITNHSRRDSRQNNLTYTVEVRHKTESDWGSDIDADGDATDVILWGDVDENGQFEQNTTIGKPIEIITSVGTAVSATNKIVVEAHRDPLDLKYAVFGDEWVKTKNSGIVWKGSADPPYEANVGSNGYVEIQSGAMIYGRVDLGQNLSGTAGTCVNNGGSILGGGPNTIDRIDPDPLEMFTPGSFLDEEFQFYSSSANNSNSTGATPAITGNTIDLGNSGTMTLRSGNYYVNSIFLGNSAALNVDASSGPVTVYLNGPLITDNSGAINLIPSGTSPGAFTIYCRAQDAVGANSVNLKNSTDFYGVIYAPRANIQLHNSVQVEGLVWGKQVTINNSGSLNFEVALKKNFYSPTYSISVWREER